MVGGGVGRGSMSTVVRGQAEVSGLLFLTGVSGRSGVGEAGWKDWAGWPLGMRRMYL